MQVGSCAGVTLFVHQPLGVLAQSSSPSRLQFIEVVRSILYTPAYAAISKGFFKDAGIDVALETGQGGDKTIAALISGRANISLMGPEFAFYVKNSESPQKVKIFCGMTATDGYMLLGRQKVDRFDWSMLKGKEVLGRPAGLTPQLFLERAMKKNGLDPRRDVKFNNNIAFPARPGAWISGQGDYGIFIEPEASQLELAGKGHSVASIGREVGPVDYTVFMATDQYISQNPALIQNWTNAIFKGLKWVESASIADIVQVQKQFFPGLDPEVLASATQRYRDLKIWKETPLVEEKPMEIWQDMLVEAGLLEPSKRVKYQDVVVTDFAKKAKAS